MEFILIAILMTIVSAYLLRQFWMHTLEADDAAPPELADREPPGLKAA